jgi:hypothetical protein
MNRTIEELKRNAEQGSQQAQGEALEADLEEMLRARFPMDPVEPVAKGELGADVVHRVNATIGSPAGIILWELSARKPGAMAGFLSSAKTSAAVARTSRSSSHKPCQSISSMLLRADKDVADGLAAICGGQWHHNLTPEPSSGVKGSGSMRRMPCRNAARGESGRRARFGRTSCSCNPQSLGRT